MARDRRQGLGDTMSKEDRKKSLERYFSEDAYRLVAEPRKLYIIPNAGHVDLYDQLTYIPFDKLTSFFAEHLR